MKVLFTFYFIVLFVPSFAQNSAVGIGTTTPNASAALDVSSIDRGMLIPRMSTEQRKLIPAPATGLLVFDNTTSSFWFRNATSWVELVDSTKQPWQKAGADVYLNTGGNVGIGTATPAQKLDVAGVVLANSFKAAPASGGLFIGSDAVGSTILRAGISQVAGGYSFMQAVKSEGSTWGDLILNLSGGNVGIGASNPSQKLDVAGNANIRGGVIVDADNANNGTLTNSLRFGAQAGVGIASKRTAGGNQNGLDFYTNNSARMSITNDGDILIGTATPSGKLTVSGTIFGAEEIKTNTNVVANGDLKTNNGNVVAFNGTVKQKTYSNDVGHIFVGQAKNFVWTHNLGYAPIIMISVEKTGGGAYGFATCYQNLNNNQTRISCQNTDSFHEADLVVKWIVVN